MAAALKLTRARAPADADDDDEEDYDLIQRAEAALALPDEHFLEVAAEHAPTNDVANAAASLE